MSDAGWGRGADGRAFRMDGQVVCDFCLTPDPTWRFPAAPMSLHGHAFVGLSDDDFAACDECKEMIVASKIGPLVERCVALHRARYPEGTPGSLPGMGMGVVRQPALPIHRQQMRKNILRFLDARKGPPVPFAAG